jgi:hypothetical protein
VIIHRQNLGYGGNQKTCYDAALAAGADAVVMLHPDYQYDATRIPALVEPILAGEKDLMLGSRFLGDPLAGGMPRWKYVSNPVLDDPREPGLRPTSRSITRLPPIAGTSWSRSPTASTATTSSSTGAGRASGRLPMRVGEIAVPTRYFKEASSVNFRRSVVYGLSTLRVILRFRLHRLRLRRSRKLANRQTLR